MNEERYGYSFIIKPLRISSYILGNCFPIYASVPQFVLNFPIYAEISHNFLTLYYQKSHLSLHFPEAWVGVGVEWVGVGGGRVRPAASQSET